MVIFADIAEYEKDPLLRRQKDLKKHVKNNITARHKRKRKRAPKNVKKEK